MARPSREPPAIPCGRSVVSATANPAVAMPTAIAKERPTKVGSKTIGNPPKEARTARKCVAQMPAPAQAPATTSQKVRNAPC